MSYKRQVMYDYNVSQMRATGRENPSRHRYKVVGLLLFCGLFAGLFAAKDTLLPNSSVSNDTASHSIDLALPNHDAEISTSAATPTGKFTTTRLPFEPLKLSAKQVREMPTSISDQAWVELTVKPGDNLSLIFGRHGYSKKDLHAILELDEAGKNLRRIKPGQSIRIKTNAKGRIIGLQQELDYLTSLHVEMRDAAYTAFMVETEPEFRPATAVVRINRSLFVDGQGAGLADNTIMAITDIFGWDIDFVLDVRKGDQFSVVYEEILKDGQKVKNGKILASEFVNQGRKLRAVYYSNEDGHTGYYSDSGKAMRKAFLRAPVNFTRISSKFNLKRRHPVLNKIRAHKGVDYAAPHGTPIRATANGKIAFAGNKGGYGRTVEIKHGDSYSTLFAHMSRYARGIKPGVRVKQGQTIGYVGKTGLATGPHLHYEFRINGVHKNPLGVNLPKALPIDKKYIADFHSKVAPLLAQLDELDSASKSEKLVAHVDSRRREKSDSSIRGQAH